NNEKSLANNEPIRLSLSARLHQRHAELLRADRRPEREVEAEVSAACEQYRQVLAADPQNADLAGDLAEVLLSNSAVKWTVLEPVTLSSKSGTTLSVQPDGSILASGVRPDQE